jgi:hypothetical protein
MNTRAGRDESPRDDRIDQAWRASSTEMPSGETDLAILAAARDALGNTDTAAKRRATVRPWWSRGAPLAAAAGVAGLAFVLLQSLPREIAQPRTLPIESSPSVQSATREAAPTADAAVPATERSASQAKNAGAVAAAPAKRERRQEASPDVAPEHSTADQLSGGSFALSEPHPQPPPEPHAWAARIARLLTDGDREAAASEFRAFYSVYPDAADYLPEDLRGWASTVVAGSGDAARQR